MWARGRFMVKDTLLSILGALILVPFIPMIISRMVLGRFISNKKKAKRISFEIATPFFIISIYALVQTIYGLKVMWILFLIILFFATLATIVQWKVSEELNILKIGRATFRIVFPISFFAYIILMGNGLVVYYLKYVYE